MPRFALLVEYLGAPFAGWQRQRDQPSVQGAIEAALAKLEPGAHTIAAAGRTDAGVHATGQVAHCDLQRDWDPFSLSEALRPWSMAEIFAIGCAVALVKVVDLADVSFGPGFWMFACLVVLVVVQDNFMCRWSVWNSLSPQKQS